MRLLNVEQLNRYILQQAIRIEKALVYMLEYMVADLQNHAKLNAGYKDQTSNLKSSIGGVVLKDGRPISYKGFDTGTAEGNKTGQDFISSLFPKYRKGFVILLVAGMEYATYVENSKNLNVLKKSELKMNAELPLMLQKLKKKIDENTK